jgi:hypothetical protein
MVQLLIRARDLSFVQSIHNRSGSTQHIIQWVTWIHFADVNQPGHEADHSPLGSAQVTGEWRSYASASQYAFVACRGTILLSLCSTDPSVELIVLLGKWFLMFWRILVYLKCSQSLVLWHSVTPSDLICNHILVSCYPLFLTGMCGVVDNWVNFVSEVQTELLEFNSHCKFDFSETRFHTETLYLSIKYKFQ